ncbi:MAG: hypothetical protein QXG39_03460 [Candidatus Aenigmatarchaeota archaeon]
MKVIKKVEILVLEDGEVLVFTTPATNIEGVKSNTLTPSGSSDTIKASSKSVKQIKQTPTPTSTSRTGKKLVKKRSFLIARIRELIQKHGEGLASYLKQADVDIDNLENMTDKQIKRAIALALNYDSNPLGVNNNTNTEDEDELGF